MSANKKRTTCKDMKDVVKKDSDDEIDKYDYVESECPDYYYSLFFPNPSMVASKYYKKSSSSPNNTMSTKKKRTYDEERTYEDGKPAAKNTKNNVGNDKIKYDNVDKEKYHNEVKVNEGNHNTFIDNKLFQSQSATKQNANGNTMSTKKHKTSKDDKSDGNNKKKGIDDTNEGNRNKKDNNDVDKNDNDVDKNDHRNKDVISTKSDPHDFIEADFHEYYMDVSNRQFD